MSHLSSKQRWICKPLRWVNAASDNAEAVLWEVLYPRHSASWLSLSANRFGPSTSNRFSQPPPVYQTHPLCRQPSHLWRCSPERPDSVCPYSASPPNVLLSGFRSRCHIVVKGACPGYRVRQGLDQLIQLYTLAGFSSEELIQISSRILDLHHVEEKDCSFAAQHATISHSGYFGCFLVFPFFSCFFISLLVLGSVFVLGFLPLVLGTKSLP